MRYGIWLARTEETPGQGVCLYVDAPTHDYDDLNRPPRYLYRQEHWNEEHMRWVELPYGDVQTPASTSPSAPQQAEQQSTSHEDLYETLQQVYMERNLLACLIAQGARYMGGVDHSEDVEEGWAVVRLMLPSGQVGFHVPKELTQVAELQDLSLVSNYDGHTKEQAMARLRNQLTMRTKRPIMVHAAESQLEAVVAPGVVLLSQKKEAYLEDMVSKGRAEELFYRMDDNTRMALFVHGVSKQLRVDMGDNQCEWLVHLAGEWVKTRTNKTET